MRLSEPEYHWYLEEFGSEKTLVRELNECLIYSAEPLLLILDDPLRHQVALFAYDTFEEREDDLRLLLRLDEDDGGAAAPFPATINPDTPPRFPGYAKQLPPNEA